MTYQKYKDDCRRLGHKPTLTEKQFYECMGVELEEVIAPMQIRPKQDRRTIDATHDNYVKIVPLPKKPKEVKAPRVKKTLEELKQSKAERQRKWYLKTKGGIVKHQFVKRISLEGMTEQEKKERKAMLRKMRDQRKKINND